MSLKKVLESVKKEIVPDKAYSKQLTAVSKEILSTINSCLKDQKAILGGSGAKGTWLKKFDVDIFVLFPYNKYKEKNEQLSVILEKQLKKKFTRLKKIHGSRDYFQIKQKGFTFEIVPILGISNADHAINITDVSPLHAKWVNKHKKTRDDIRLTKQFCQAQRVYGAESYIQGFSGYVCEILTIHYGSFEKLIKAGSKWKTPVVVDTNKVYARKDIFHQMNKSKLVSPLIVVDPVQAQRNAAAAISLEKFEKFITQSKALITKPSPEFFTKQNVEHHLRKKHPKKEILSITLTPLKGKEDVVGSKLRKLFHFFTQQLHNHDFTIVDADWEWEQPHQSTQYFVFSQKELPPTIEIKGPPARNKLHSKKFRKAHKQVFTKGTILYAKEKRTYRKPHHLLQKMIKHDYCTQRCRKAILK